MSTLTSLARAIAASTGAAQPVCTVRHVHISPRPLVFVPIALAGEVGAPLAAMVGDDPAAPALLVVPEPGSVPAVGESLCYATLSDAWQPPPALPEPEDTPWTHGGPPPVYVPSGEEAAEDWS